MESFTDYAHYVGFFSFFSLTTPLMIVDKVSPIIYLSTRRHAQMPEKEIKEDDKEELRSYEGEEE